MPQATSLSAQLGTSKHRCAAWSPSSLGLRNSRRPARSHPGANRGVHHPPDRTTMAPAVPHLAAERETSTSRHSHAGTHDQHVRRTPRTRHPHPRHGSQHRPRRTPRGTADRGLRTPRNQDARAATQPTPRRRRRPRPPHQRSAPRTPRADRRTHEEAAQYPLGDSTGRLALPRTHPGQPRDPQYLNRRLRPLGVTISALQNTARFRLAGAVPAKVLADVLGFRVITFENYARLSGSTRGDYPALRDATYRRAP